MSAFDPVKNFLVSAVSTGYSAGDGVIVLATGQGTKWPTTAEGGHDVVWYDSTKYPDVVTDPNLEIVRVTARTTDTLTITRAQQGTSASNKNTAGSTYKVMSCPTAKTIADISTAIQTGSMHYAADAVGTDSYAITLSPVPAGYTTGMRIVFKASSANTGAASLNANSLGAISLVDATGGALLSNTILADSFVEVVYDGSSFVIVSVTPSLAVNNLKANNAIYFDAEYAAPADVPVSPATTFALDPLNGNKQSVVLRASPTAIDITPLTGAFHLLLKVKQGGSGSYTLPEVRTATQPFAVADVNTGTFIITTGSDIPTGARITFTNVGGALPAGLVADTVYWAIRVDATKIKVATTYALAIAGTNKTDISNQGSGTSHYVHTLVKWAGGTKPTLTTAVGGTDILSFYYDGAQGFGASSLAFS